MVLVRKKVIILGGGVAGMSAAHELVERGFEVEVYECSAIAGGKARSIPSPKTGRDGRKDLPGEHGFRFFPRFYKHITDTMKRIPYKNNKKGVYDNLVDTTRLALARAERTPVIVPTKFPKTLADLELVFKDVLFTDLGLTSSELEFFATKIWQLLTSCKERRLEEYEKISWWNYLEADKYSQTYRDLLVKGITRSLVASKAELASTRTVGKIFLQLLFDIIEPGISSDRILNGPTTEVWLRPWLEYLQQCGVDYHYDSEITSINCVGGMIQSVTIKPKNREFKNEYQVQGDYYIAAIPIEIMVSLLNDDLIKADPSLENIKQLSLSTAWMNGIQFYLKEDVEITHGHVLYIDSPWALTSISQKQFWENTDLSKYGDGNIKGILSVCISDWGFYINPATGEAAVTDNSKGEYIQKRANHCTPEEVKEEVWYQLKKSLNVNGEEVLKDENLHDWFLDPDIANTTSPDFEQIVDAALLDPLKQLFIWIMKHEEGKGYVTLSEVVQYLHKDEIAARNQIDLLVAKGFVAQVKDRDESCYRTRLEAPANINLEPLLVNLVNTWHLRPDASTKIPNFFLAGDYVRTNTDLATMEGANEAARRAVNGIVDNAKVNVPYCQIWDSQEPDIFPLWRLHDYSRYKQGLPWKEEIPWGVKILQSLYQLFNR